MIKLAVFQVPNTPASIRYYRTMLPLKMMQNEMIQVDFIKVQDINEVSLYLYDWVFVERPYLNLKIVELAKKAGCKIWVDEDDDRQNIPPRGNIGRDFYLSEQNIKAVNYVYSIADLLTVATPTLQKLLSGYQNAVLIPNAFNDYRSRPERRNQVDNIMPLMVWRGANQHQPDFDPIQSGLTKAYSSKKAQWLFMGYSPHWLPLAHNEEAPFQPLPVYFQTMRTAGNHGNSWGWVTLKHGPFNDAKSELAWIEFTEAGLPCILPDAFPSFDGLPAVRYSGGNGFAKVFDDVCAGRYSGANIHAESLDLLVSKYRLSKWVSERQKLLK